MCCVNRAGLSKGYAFVFLENEADVPKAIDYVDGRHINGRQLRAKTSLVDSSNQK